MEVEKNRVTAGATPTCYSVALAAGGHIMLKEDVAVGETRKGGIRRREWIDGRRVETEHVDDRDGYVV